MVETITLGKPTGSWRMARVAIEVPPVQRAHHRGKPVGHDAHGLVLGIALLHHREVASSLRGDFGASDIRGHARFAQHPEVDQEGVMPVAFDDALQVFEIGGLGVEGTDERNGPMHDVSVPSRRCRAKIE
jgi:hypothetical protein